MQMGCKCSTSSSRVYEGFLLISVGHISFIWGWVRGREELPCALSKTGGEYSTYPLLEHCQGTQSTQSARNTRLYQIELCYWHEKKPIVQRNLIIDNELRA